MDNIISSLIPNYRPGWVHTFYGNAASGKTTTCLLATIEAAKKGKVIFVDTEGGFDAERLRQLHGGDVKDILENVFLIQPKSFEEQHATILKVKQLCENPKINMVVVDTIGNYYRTERNENPTIINKKLVMQARELYRMARDMKKIVLITNQVYADIEGEGIKMVGGTIVPHLSHCIIELHKEDDVRTGTLKKFKWDKKEDYPGLEKSVGFNIVEKGLVLADRLSEHIENSE